MNKTEEELFASLEEAYQQSLRGEGGTAEELMTELSEKSLTASLCGVLKRDYDDTECYAERIEKRESRN